MCHSFLPNPQLMTYNSSVESKRLPRQRMIRDVMRIRRELEWWAQQYAQAAQDTSNQYLEARFKARAAGLGRATGMLERVEDEIYELPRTSL